MSCSFRWHLCACSNMTSCCWICFRFSGSDVPVAPEWFWGFPPLEEAWKLPVNPETPLGPPPPTLVLSVIPVPPISPPTPETVGVIPEMTGLFPPPRETEGLEGGWGELDVWLGLLLTGTMIWALPPKQERERVREGEREREGERGREKGRGGERGERDYNKQRSVVKTSYSKQNSNT